MVHAASVRILVGALGVGLFFLNFATPWANAGSSDFLIKFATVAPEGSTWMKQMRELDRSIRNQSDGRLGFRFYPGGVGGDEIDVLKKMRIGQFHGAAFSGVGFGQVLPMVRVLDLPFLFRNAREVDTLQKELAPFFAEAFRKSGFELLSWAEVGQVHLFSKTPISRVRDFAGLKVWTWSGDPIAKETFSAMGISPIPLVIADVTTALNTGMIDTVYAPPLGALALQWHTATRYMTALPLAHSTGAVLISSRYFDTLPPDLAHLLKEAMEKAMVDLTSTLRKQNTEAIQLIRESGLVVTPRPPEKDLEDFYHIHRVVAQNLTDTLYPKALLERVYGILGSLR